MSRRVFVAGVGMTKFEKPGSKDWDYPDMVRESGTKALDDAGIDFSEVQQAAAGYVYGDSCAGQRAVYQLGETGIPIYNVNNNCSTGSTALMMARQWIEGGLADVVMAVGFEKMEKGSLKGGYTDRTNPLDRHVMSILQRYPYEQTPVAPQMFGNAGREHMERYGSTPEHFAMVGEKNHRHSANNPYAQFQNVHTLQEILDSPPVHAPLTRLQCSPTSEGSGAVILMSEDAIKRHGLEGKAVEIAAQTMVTDFASSFDGQSAIKAVGSDLTAEAARQVYAKSGFGPDDIDVIELHDCFSTNEVITYEGLGLAPEGKGHLLLESGDTTYGGKWVVNPSGGLISKGHPLGATGLAQCAELTWQLRGEAGARQVDGAKVALQHNLGLGGAAVVTIYKSAA